MHSSDGVTYTTERGTYTLIDCGEGFWAIKLTLASGEFGGDVGRAESPVDESGYWMATRTFYRMAYKPPIKVYRDHALDVLEEFAKQYEEAIPDAAEEPRMQA